MIGLSPGLTNQSVASAGVEDTADQILEQTSATLTLSAVGGTLTADGNEQNLYYDNEPLGVFSPVALILDLDLMQVGDTIVVKVYHRISDAGTLKLFRYRTWTGADGGLMNGEKFDQVEMYPCRHGFRVTLQQTGGVNRDYPWELFLGV